MTDSPRRRQRMTIALLCICAIIVTYNVYSIETSHADAAPSTDVVARRDTLLKSLNGLQARYNSALQSQAAIRDSLQYCIKAGPGSQMRYQAYLYNLANSFGLHSIVVQQGSPFFSDTRTQRLSCSTQVAGPVGSVVQFMQAIEAQSPAHRVTSARLNVDKDEIHGQIESSICTTVIPEASNSLSVSENLPTEILPESTAIRSLFGFRSSVASKPKVSPPAPVPAPSKKIPSISEHLMLVGTIKTSSSQEAVLLDMKSGNFRTLSKGDILDCGDGTHATVTSVGLDAVLLRRHAITRIFNIGSNLNSVF